MDILFRVSANIEQIYLNSLKEVINLLTEEVKNLQVDIEPYEFSELEITKISVSGNAFLNSKFSGLDKNNFNSIIYIPDSSRNLKGNYLWYSIGEPDNHVMIISSFLFKRLIEGRLDFGSYILILYSQFLARCAVEPDEPHDISKNCLNDHCTDQTELLNVLSNEKDVFCNECLFKKPIKEYHDIIKSVIGLVKGRYSPKEIKKTNIQKAESSAKIKPYDGHWYEFEIYMAKKCANMSQLYEKLDQMLSNPDFEINGYSLYEVGGGWRDSIELKHASEDEWKKLYSFQKKFGNNDFKDVIRPLIEKEGKKYVVYDESSIVLRLVIKSEIEIKSLDESKSEVIREIQLIFNEITENENSVFFTMKKLDRVGSIQK